MEKVRIASKTVADGILGKSIVGIGCSKDLIEIEVDGHKLLLFKLNETHEDGWPTIYFKDLSEERKRDGLI